MIKQLTRVLRPMCRDTSAVRKICLSRVMCREQTSLARQLRAKILATGPITVSEYMKEVLVNPASGYYTQQESIGEHGDFVTSPELSQLFGEMIAVWILNEWQKIGSPKPMQLVELGPGKGTLMDDVLRVLGQLSGLDGVSVHLVELSPRLRSEQAQRLCCEASLGGENFTWGTAHAGCSVTWHHSLSEVPRDVFTCVLAHEFFDALPVHKLQKTSDGWREVLVDLDPSVKDEVVFRYVQSRGPTPACNLFPAKSDDPREHREVCPEAGALLQELASRFEQDGGFLLMADYGHNGTGGDTFRGFQRHQLHDPLRDPGSADLTADVDFSFLKDCVAGQALTFGPQPQGVFLEQLGIHLRLQVLLQSSELSPQARETLQAGVHKLTDPAEMGQRFNFFCMFPQVLEKHLAKFPVAGFASKI